jgi:phenylacetic acid degradation operon negative regulatory protein
MTFLGYAQLDEATWIGPRISQEVDALLAAEEARADRFTATHDGDTAHLVARAWDLDGLARSYNRWLSAAKNISTDVDESATDEQAFAARSRLVHEWRKFLFLDPGLPRELLPEPWAGETAAEFFDQESARLLPGAVRFVDTCLSVPKGH